MLRNFDSNFVCFRFSFIFVFHLLLLLFFLMHHWRKLCLVSNFVFRFFFFHFWGPEGSGSSFGSRHFSSFSIERWSTKQTPNYVFRCLNVWFQFDTICGAYHWIRYDSNSVHTRFLFVWRFQIMGIETNERVEKLWIYRIFFSSSEYFIEKIFLYLIDDNHSRSVCPVNWWIYRRRMAICEFKIFVHK